MINPCKIINHAQFFGNMLKFVQKIYEFCLVLLILFFKGLKINMQIISTTRLISSNIKSK